MKSCLNSCFARFAAVVCALCATSLPLFAQGKPPVSKPADVAATPRIEQPSAEVIALRAQLETMKEYDGRILDTVYWSLAGMFGVVFLVVGAGFFINFKFYEKDKEAIKSDLLNQLRGDLDRRHEKDKEAIAAQIKPIPSMLEAASKDATAGLDRRIKEMSRDLHEVQFKTLRTEAEKLRKDGIYNISIDNECEMIYMTQKAGEDWRVDASLRNIKSVLTTLIENGSLLNSDTSKRINKALASIPSHWAAQASVINELATQALTPKTTPPGPNK